MVNGFLLNNELTLFDAPLDAEGNPAPNGPEGGKRPTSSMSPTIVVDSNGKPKIATGSPGGTNIIAYTAASIWNILEFGLDAQQAINVPHYINNNAGTNIEAPSYPTTLDYNATEMAAALTALGHDVSVVSPADPFSALNSGTCVVTIEDDMSLKGGADPRRDNVAIVVP